MIDLHSHILPGLDDGAKTFAAALELARDAVADGIRLLAATPHVRADYQTTPAEMEALVESLRGELLAAEIPLELLPGGEIAFDRLPELDDSALRRFGLGGNPRYLLLETPYATWPLDLEDSVTGLRHRGFTVVLAHPERNGDVQARPERLRPLVEQGLLVQLTAASIAARSGPHAKRTAAQLIELGLAHLVASDAHGPPIRPVGLTAAARALGDEPLARWLTEDVPGAIVAGDEIPARPAAAGSRGRRWTQRG